MFICHLVFEDERWSIYVKSFLLSTFAGNATCERPWGLVSVDPNVSSHFCPTHASSLSEMTGRSDQYLYIVYEELAS